MTSRPSPPVKAWLERNFEELEHLADTTQPDHALYPHVQALWTSERALRRKAPYGDALKSLRLALDASQVDGELHVALLLQSSKVSLNLGLTGEARRTLDLARQLWGATAPSEWKAWMISAESAYFLALGQAPKALELLNQAWTLRLREGSVSWYLMKVQSLWTAINAEEYTLAEHDLAEIKKHPHLESKAAVPIRFFEAFLCHELGKAEEGLAVLNAPPKDSTASGADLLGEIRIQLLLKAGRLEEATELLARLPKDTQATPPFVQESLRAQVALARPDFPAARHHLRQAIARTSQAAPKHLEFAMALAAQVELATRRPEAARLILRMLDRNEERRELSLHWVRLYLLENDEARATAHFRKVLGRARSEVISEGLRYAYEISGSQVARLHGLAAVPGPLPRPTAAVEKPSRASLVGESPALRRVRESIGKYAPLGQTVLLTGETGTGKEVVARMLHERGAHPREPLIPVNCAAISDTLIEAEMFGYVKGAFTGATQDHDGLFVAAGKGTLFLDEVGSMSLRLQGALLRALENREIRPVGSTRVRPFEARMIAATSIPLEQAIAKGEFRSDLYYRLATFHIELPPLRDRREDIPLLASHFLKEFATDSAVSLGEDLLAALKNHPWPGNLRELRNEVQRMLVLSEGKGLWGADLFRLGEKREASPPSPAPTPHPDGLYAQMRRDRLLKLFETYPQLTREKAAVLIGCARNTAAKDLNALEAQGAIQRVRVPGSDRTLCFTRSRPGWASIPGI